MKSTCASFVLMEIEIVIISTYQLIEKKNQFLKYHVFHQQNPFNLHKPVFWHLVFVA